MCLVPGSTTTSLLALSQRSTQTSLPILNGWCGAIISLGTVLTIHFAEHLESFGNVALTRTLVLGPSTPPSLLRSELRSPVVVRTMPLQHSPDMSTILSSPSTLSSIDTQHHLGRSSHLGVKQSSTVDHSMESHMISGLKVCGVKGRWWKWQTEGATFQKASRTQSFFFCWH